MMEPNPNVAAIVAGVVGIVTAIASAYGAIKVAQLKTHINSRMDELIKLNQEVAHAKGMLDGVASERATVAVQAKTKADLKETSNPN